MGAVLASLRDDAERSSQTVRFGGAAWRAAWREREQWDRRRWNLERCGDIRPVPLRCEAGHEWSHRPMGCGYRFCEQCHRVEQQRKRDSLLERFGRFQNRLRMATLTVRNRPAGELADQVAELEAAWAKLQQHPAWRPHVRGGVAVLELTASQARGWHAHLHVVWDGQVLNQKALWEAWNECLGYGRLPSGLPACGLPDLRAAASSKESAAGYLAHYASKGIEVRRCDARGDLIRGASGKPVDGDVADLSFGMLKEWVRVWWSKRTLRPFGVHLGTPESQEPRAKWDGVLRCPCCHEPAVLTEEAVRLYSRMQADRARWEAREAELRYRRRRELLRRGLAEVPF